MAERRPRCVPVRMRDTRTAKQQSRYVSISRYVRDQKVAGLIPVWGSETFSEFVIKLE